MMVNSGYLKYFTSHLYRFLEEGHSLNFSKLRKFTGKIDWYPSEPDNAAVIVLDHREDIVPTIIHEFIHYKYPDMSEKDVIAMEEAIVSRLSNRRIKNIIKKFAEAL